MKNKIFMNEIYLWGFCISKCPNKIKIVFNFLKHNECVQLLFRNIILNDLSESHIVKVQVCKISNFIAIIIINNHLLGFFFSSDFDYIVIHLTTINV